MKITIVPYSTLSYWKSSYDAYREMYAIASQENPDQTAQIVIVRNYDDSEPNMSYQRCLGFHLDDNSIKEFLPCLEKYWKLYLVIPWIFNWKNDITESQLDVDYTIERIWEKYDKWFRVRKTITI